MGWCLQIVFGQNHHVSKYEYDEVRAGSWCCVVYKLCVVDRCPQHLLLRMQVGPSVVHRKCFA